MDTVIIVDSSCDLPLEFIEENKIPHLGLVCHLDGKDYIDDFGKTLTYKDFYNKLREGSMPTTSQINVYRFQELFKKYVVEGKSVIYLAMSSRISGCYSSAVIAKKYIQEDYPNADITIVDTKSACIGEGLIVYYAYELLKKGASSKEIVEWVEENKLKTHHWFIVEDLIHLKKGGRLSSAKANIGTLLKIKPMIYIDKEGNLQNITNIRGRKKAMKILLDKFEENVIIDENTVIAISHGNCIDDAMYLKNMVMEKYNIKKVILNYVGPVIASHTGGGMLSLCFLGKERVI